MSQLGFSSCINKRTRTKSCIDHIFIKTRLNLDKLLSVVLNSKITDHSETYLTP